MINETNDLSYLIKPIVFFPIRQSKLNRIWEGIIEEFLREFKPEIYFKLFELKKSEIKARNRIIQGETMEGKLDLIDIETEKRILENEGKGNVDEEPYLFEKYGNIDKKKISVKVYRKLVIKLIEDAKNQNK
jgi:hypothetical protein